MKKANCLLLLLITSFLWNKAIAQATDNCGSVPLPSVTFAKGSVLPGPKAKTILDAVARLIKANTTCKVKVMSYMDMTMAGQQASWDKVYSVIDYLAKKGVDRERFIFSYGNTSGLIQLVDLMFTTEDGPNTMPVPMACKSAHKVIRQGCK